MGLKKIRVYGYTWEKTDGKKFGWKKKRVQKTFRVKQTEDALKEFDELYNKEVTIIGFFEID